MNISNEKDIAVTTRIRLARNIASLPYPRKMTKAQAEELIKTVWDAFSNSPLKNELKNLELEKFNKIKNTGYFDAINNAVECKICKDKGRIYGKRCKCFNKKLTEISLKYLGVTQKERCTFKNANAKEIEKQKWLQGAKPLK